MKFTEGENNIAWVSLSFKEYFDGMPVRKGEVLTGTKLPRDMNDEEIPKELKPGEVSLGDVYETLKTMSHEMWALFYVSDKETVLRAVDVHWLGDGWRVYAGALDGRRWSADGRVFSRNSCPPEPLNTLAPESLDPLARIAAALESIAETYKTVAETKEKK